jgi:replicative DNA helicase
MANPLAGGSENRYSFSSAMAQKNLIQSEGEQLDALLADLQREHDIKEISGWESGFPSLSRALNGIIPGLYWLIGPPSCGKTSLSKQLLDQVVRHNSVPGIFFSFTEKKKELGIRTLSRLSGLENREIRRGSAYLLHWYGVPKAPYTDAERLPPGWEKLRRSAEEARSWLNLAYVIECDRRTTLQEIEDRIGAVKQMNSRDQVIVVIDDSHRLGFIDQSLEKRIAAVSDQLQGMAIDLNVAVIAVWPNLHDQDEALPQVWSDRVAAADVVLVVKQDTEQIRNLNEPNRRMTIHIVKNRGGERGALAFEFFPAFSRFVEVEQS